MNLLLGDVTQIYDFRRSIDNIDVLFPIFTCSLSGCPRASANKKRVKLPGDEYISKKFRASDGKTCAISIFFSRKNTQAILTINHVM